MIWSKVDNCLADGRGREEGANWKSYIVANEDCSLSWTEGGVSCREKAANEERQ